MTKRYLINEREAAVLTKLVHHNRFADNLQADSKAMAISQFVRRCKLLEAMGATTAGEANAAVYALGDSTDNILDTANVIDDSSVYSNALSGDKCLVIASSEYFLISIPLPSARSYLGLSTTDYASTDTSVVIDNLQAMDGEATTETTLTAVNRFQWDVINNKQCYIRYSDYSSQYELLQTWCST